MIASRGMVWKQTGWAVRADNDRELMMIMGSIGVHSAGSRFAWKGLQSADFELSSTLSRSLRADAGEREVGSAERAILSSARNWGLGMAAGHAVNDLQLLADLQHFGIATRLIDFTSNPMTALWFACQAPPDRIADQRPSKVGVLLALNISRFREVRTQRNNAGETFEDLAGSSISELVETRTPSVIRSNLPNERLRAQEGFFVAGQTPKPGFARALSPFPSFHVDYTKGDADDLKTFLMSSTRTAGAPRQMPFIAILIPSDLKTRLRRILEATYNRSAMVLFPDFEGLRNYGGLSIVNR